MGDPRHGKCIIASLHLLGKRNRAGKFSRLQGAFRALLLPRQGTGTGQSDFPQRQGACRWVIFSRSAAGKMIFLPPLGQLPGGRMLDN